MHVYVSSFCIYVLIYEKRTLRGDGSYIFCITYVLKLHQIDRLRLRGGHQEFSENLVEKFSMTNCRSSANCSTKYALSLIY